MIPAMTIYAINKRKWIRYSGDICLCGYKHKGRQHRIPTKSRNDAGAARFRRELEARYEAAENNKPVEQNQPVTIEQAIAAFIAEKVGGGKSKTTIAKFKLTLRRLLDYCTKQNIIFIREITLAHLSAWRAEWNKVYGSTFALRNEQSRVRAFFTYCANAQLIQFNPAKALSAITIRDEDYTVDPFSEAEVNKVIKAVDKCTDITAVNRDRTRVLMQLQRWSGLSLIDSVCLSRDDRRQVSHRYQPPKDWHASTGSNSKLAGQGTTPRQEWQPDVLLSIGCRNTEVCRISLRQALP